MQARVLWGTLVAVALAWLAAAAWIARDAHHELEELLDAHLAQSAALLVARAAGADADDDHDDALDQAFNPRHGRGGEHRLERRVAFQVWHEGRLVQHSPNAAGEALGSGAEGFETLRRDGHDWRLYTRRAAGHDTVVHVAEQVQARESVLWALLRGMLAPLALLLPLLGVLLWGSVRRALAPLQALEAALRRRGPQDLGPLALPQTPPAELQAPVEALDALFARIATLLESERRFTADAAHELRTPIAVIRTQAQVALGATDEAGRRHALQATVAGCDRATQLVQQLLTLARLEGSDAARAATPLDLQPLARRVLAELAPQALDRGQQLSLDTEAACPLAADEALCAMLLRNLVDNALRHSPAGATVQVALAPAAGGAALTVEDSGPGLPEADLARLGERFFRAGASQASGGSGLGWSIVRRIAQAQRAEVLLDRSPALGGLRVRVRWPA
jgi:two-component system sensor histidine kinase QseC